MPGSTPEQRPLHDIQYKQNYGKAPLLEKRDSRYRQQLQQRYEREYGLGTDHKPSDLDRQRASQQRPLPQK